VDFRSFPKVELHRHLEGSVRFGTFVELARDVGIELPRRELLRRTSMKGEKPGFSPFMVVRRSSSRFGSLIPTSRASSTKVAKRMLPSRWR